MGFALGGAMRGLVAGAIAVLITAAAGPGQAADWSVVLNGKAVHVDSSRDWNESNWGLGFEREFDAESRWVKVALGNGFRDSRNEMSYMAGGGIKRRFRPLTRSRDFYVDVGVVGFMMTRQDVDDNAPFPGLLPALTFGSRHVALNVTYLPTTLTDRAMQVKRADPTVDGVFFLQLKLDASLFGFRGARSRLALASTAQ